MNTSTLADALNFTLIIGLNFLWYIPIWRTLRHPTWIFITINILEYICALLLFPAINEITGGYTLIMVLVMLTGMFFLGRILSGYDFIKSLCLFMWAGALTSFCSALARTVIIISSYNEAPIESPLFEPAFAAVICLIACICIHLLKKIYDYSFLTDPNVPIVIWLSFLPIPIIIFHQNILHLAGSIDQINSSQELYSYVMMLVGNLLLFIFLTATFSYVAVMYVRNYKILEEKRILELQTSQYSDIKREVERSNKNLHDLKHTINTLRNMAITGNNDEILSYLDNISTSSSVNILNYCDNIAVNSVLNHYCLIARQDNVPINLQVDLPGGNNALPMSDPELCSLIGNIMENAIDASREISPEDRRFDISIVMKNSTLYIVTSNTFDGYIEKSGEEYLSTKHDGFGIGIRSIKETVERYGGTYNIQYNENEFFADICIEFHP